MCDHDQSLYLSKFSNSSLDLTLSSNLNRKTMDEKNQEANSSSRYYKNKSIPYRTLALIFLVSGYLFNTMEALPINSNTGAMMYLSQYGWLDKSSMKPGSAALLDIRGAIQEFQAFAGLNQTGELDDETVKLMGTPRCGVRDKIGHDARRRKRYVLQGSRWKVRDLTYKITKYPNKLTKTDVDSEIEEAFKVWERETNLTFRMVPSSGKAHIEIQFQKGEHGDGDAFDGEGGTLAHAYFPVYGGDAHFDDEEKWTVRSRFGTNLFQVAAHEFGHSLGLSHSDVRGALMAPFYRGYQSSFKLDQDDVLAIQSLYGKKQAFVPAPSPPQRNRPTIKPTKGGTGSSKPGVNQLCTNPKIDAITTLGDKATYAFQGDDYYKLTESSVAEGYPRKISDDFGLPGNLDAAFTWTNDKTYFFKGRLYWRFQNFDMDDGYPKDINDGFEGIPPNIDAAFVWGGNGKIYFFKDDKYYRFDPTKRPPVGSGYPKSISNWEGIPNNLDAALKYTNGMTYFFKGNKYYRFNDRNFAVDVASPSFPRPTGTWWYGCGEKGTSAMKNDNSAELPSPDFVSGASNEAGNRIDVVTRPPKRASRWWTRILDTWTG